MLEGISLSLKYVSFGLEDVPLGPTGILFGLKGVLHRLEHIFLKLEITKKVLGITVTLISLPFGVLAIALGSLATSPIGAIVNAFPNQKLLNYSIKEQCLDLLPFVGISAIMGASIWPLQYLALPELAVVLLQILLGMMIYVICSALFKIDCYFETLAIIKQFFCHRNKYAK